jgi:hypothetical protein
VQRHVPSGCGQNRIDLRGALVLRGSADRDPQGTARDTPIRNCPKRGSTSNSGASLRVYAEAEKGLFEGPQSHGAGASKTFRTVSQLDFGHL